MNKIVPSIACLAFVIELGMITFLNKTCGYYLSPMILFLSSLCIGGLALKTAFIIQHSSPTPNHTPKYKTLILLCINIMGSIMCIHVLEHIFQQYPIGTASDIIPQVTTLVQRWLSGVFPYQTIHFSGYDLFPTYQPLQWLPFSLPQVLGFDYRWFSFGILLISIIIYHISLLKQTLSIIQVTFLSLLPYVCVYTISLYSPINVGVTIEFLIAGYYLMLTLSIKHRSCILNALGITLCLLSRYSIVMWIPLYLVVLYSINNKIKALKIIGLLIVSAFVIYVLPFYSKDNSILIKGYTYHTQAAISEWSGQSWQTAGDKPSQLFQGVGFACYVYEVVKGNISERLFVLQTLHVICSLFAILVLGVLFFKYKQRLNIYLYLMASLKIYLSVFYSFIQIPYSYLLIVPLFVSLPILAVLLELTNEHNYV